MSLILTPGKTSSTKTLNLSISANVSLLIVLILKALINIYLSAVSLAFFSSKTSRPATVKTVFKARNPQS